MSKSSWLIYGRKDCGYTEKALKILKDRHINYDLILVNPEDKKSKFLSLKSKIGDHNTFPVIFLNDTFIGGYDDLQKYFSKIANDESSSRRVVVPKGKRSDRTTFHGSPHYSYTAMLYISKKHKDCCVVIPVEESPSRHEEISLRYNERNRTISVPKNFWNKLKQCKTKRFIVFPFGFTCKKNGHSNYIIYDKKNKTMERFEPHGSPDGILDKSLIPCIDAPVDEDILKLFTSNMGSYFIDKYYKPLEFCPRIGFQTLQEKEKYMKYDPDGFCSAWSCWYTDLRLLNPDMNSKDLIEKTMIALKASPEKITDFIRNYSQFIVDVSKEISKKDIECHIDDTGGSYCVSSSDK